MVMLRSYMCPKLTIYIYISPTFSPLSSAYIGGTTVIIGCPPHISCGQCPQVGHQKRLDTVKETLAAEGVKGHSRFYGRVTKTATHSRLWGIFWKKLPTLGWKMMEYMHCLIVYVTLFWRRLSTWLELRCAFICFLRSHMLANSSGLLDFKPGFCVVYSMGFNQIPAAIFCATSNWLSDISDLRTSRGILSMGRCVPGRQLRWRGCSWKMHLGEKVGT